MISHIISSISGNDEYFKEKNVKRRGIFMGKILGKMLSRLQAIKPT